MPYPLFVNLLGKLCVVVGGGQVAERRVPRMLVEGAIVKVVSPQATVALCDLALAGKIELLREPYAAHHLAGAFLVLVATDDPAVNDQAARDAKPHRVLLCRADRPDDGDYVTPAVVKRGDLTIAVGTASGSPTLSWVVRERIEDVFGPEWDEWSALFAALRSDLQALNGPKQRNTIVKALLADPEIDALIRSGRLEDAEKNARTWILSHSE